ncbi:hypothetical protein M8C21_005141, partial [Ambrosia artemisiifolia]
METPHDDNTKSLKRLICSKDDQDQQLPLYENSTKNQVSIDILRKKIVLLLVSDLDCPPEELSILDQMYREARLDPTRPESQYEVVWLPVVPNHMTTPWTEGNQIKFEELRNMMPWYSVFHPSLLDPTVIEYIKKVWHLKQKPLLVVMDHQGRIVNTNALHMMWIWGSVAFPFTSVREEALWREETWRMDLLADSIEPMLCNWIAEGEDMEWIRKFTTTAQTMARRAGIQLEMLYVGKSNPREKVRKTNEIIRAENLSYVLPDLVLIWLFWVRLESMLASKIQHTKSSDTLATDPIIKWISGLLTYDGNDQSWALISRGSNGGMIRAEGDTLFRSFNNYHKWQDEAQDKGFLSALQDHVAGQCQPHHCNRLVLSRNHASGQER